VGKNQFYLASAVHKGLKGINNPTRTGFEPFYKLKIASHFSFTKDVPVIQARKNLNRMLEYYVDQLNSLQPILADVMRLRFFEGKSIKWIAGKYHVSVDQVNRLQRQGIRYVAYQFYDDELLLTRKLRKQARKDRSYKRGLMDETYD
jgi:hypothetical protein